MEQTTQYLYEYQNGKRVRNIGFMKIEKQLDKCVMQIYAKSVDEIKGILFEKDSGEKYLGGWETEVLPVEEEPTTVARTQDMQEQSKELQEQQEIDTYIPSGDTIYEKITRHDISGLPRREWRVANNSFLLHGYHNYHHLLYIKENGKMWLGVPGIFHEKEQLVATSFGFPEFRRLTDSDLKLEENERNTYEDFGYWCRQIPLS